MGVPSHAFGPVDIDLRSVTIGDLLREAAHDSPGLTALIAGCPEPSDRRSWTYAELLREAENTAQALLGRFNPGERVALWAPNLPEWMILEFATAMAGLVLVTVNPAFGVDEVTYVINQSQSSGLIVATSHRGNPMLEIAHEVHERCSMLREVISVDELSQLVADRDPSTPLPSVKATDDVMIQYTSGTTGFPKGALLHHHGLVNNAAHTAQRMGVPHSGTWVCPMPLFHTGGCVLGVLSSVSQRCTLVLLETFEPALTLELIETYKASAMLAVPTMIIALLEHPDYGRRDLSSLEALCSGGSTVPGPLVERLEAETGAAFTIVFGQTECSPVASMTSRHDSVEDKTSTLGSPMPHTEVRIIDPETGDVVPTGTPGEFCTRGYHVMTGYFEMPDATAAAIDHEGWLHTGDLCVMDDRGYTRIEGRLKDMIIRGGENIYPREIEEVLFEHPAVAEVAVIGLPDERWGETVAAVIRPVAGHVLNRSELVEAVRLRLAPHKTPRQWFVIDSFPLTGSGKIQKFRLVEMENDGTLTELN